MQVLHRVSFLLTLLVMVVSTSTQVIAQTTVFTFEGQSDGTPITSIYSSLGVDFSGATIATAGLTLNESEFPPVSGNNVIFDDGGPITGKFSHLVTSYGGYFTYASPITLVAYDQLGHVLTTTTSSFSQNFTSSGNAPNEFLSLTDSAGISSFSIEGAPDGSSFTLDDFTLTSGASSVPEPSPSIPFAIGSAILSALLWRKRHISLRQ